MGLQLAVMEKLLGEGEEGLGEFEVGLHGGNLLASIEEGFVEDGVHERECRLDAFSRQLDGKDGAVLGAFGGGGKGVGADLGRGLEGNGVPYQFEGVVGILVDGLAAVWVPVVVDGIGADRLDVVVIVRAAGGKDFVAGEFGILDR